MNVSNHLLIMALACLTLHLSAQFTHTHLDYQLTSLDEYDAEGWVVYLPSVSASLVSSGYSTDGVSPTLSPR